MISTLTPIFALDIRSNGTSPNVELWLYSNEIDILALSIAC